MSRTLVWFRSDLRVADHPALARASREPGDGVEGVFLLAPGQWREHDWGVAKVDFVLRNLGCLSARLDALGIPLHVLETDRFADAPKALVRLARARDARRITCHRELEINERRRDIAVARALAEDGRELLVLDDQTVVRPEDLETTAGRPYTVFTPFRRAWVRRVEDEGIGDPLPPPRARGAAAPGAGSAPRSLPGFDGAPRSSAELWPAGEAEAKRRLDEFLSRGAAAYARCRDLPARSGTSALSPYLSLGVISQRTCLAAAAAANGGRLEGGGEGLGAWIVELVWREFYRHVLLGYPRVSMSRAFQEPTQAVRWRADEGDLERWAQGRTGVPFVDAGMRQLAATGWMHNRLRMVTAQFLAKDLLLDWRLGERHFMRHLIDGDLASNNGGWQWSASTGTDAAPYFRIFNPWTQGKRYDPDGTYIRRWVPELAGVPTAALHDAAKIAALEPPGYPQPQVDHARARERCLEAFRRARAGA